MKGQGRRVAIVVGSGGMKCASALGLWQVLQREGIEVSMAVGSSGGSIYAAFMALGHDAATAEALTVDLWTPDAMSGYTSRLRAVQSGKSRFTERSGLADGQRLTNRLEQGFGGQTFADTRLPLYIVSTDLYSGEPVVVRARIDGHLRQGDRVIVRGMSTLGGWSAELPAAVDEEHEGIGALWARARIEDLMDRRRRGTPEEEIRGAVVSTALEHHLVSRYTSLVAVDKTPVRPAAAGLSKEQVASLLPHGQSPAAIFGFPATATGAASYRLSGTLLLIMAGIVAALSARRQRRALPVAI